jgi:hypothetical protein
LGYGSVTTHDRGTKPISKYCVGSVLLRASYLRSHFSPSCSPVGVFVECPFSL